MTSSSNHKNLFCMLHQRKNKFNIFIYKMVQTLAQPKINKESLTNIAIKTQLKCPKMIWSWNAHNRFTLNPFLGELFLHSFFYFTFELFNTNTLSVQNLNIFSLVLNLIQKSTKTFCILLSIRSRLNKIGVKLFSFKVHQVLDWKTFLGFFNCLFNFKFLLTGELS